MATKLRPPIRPAMGPGERVARPSYGGRTLQRRSNNNGGRLIRIINSLQIPIQRFLQGRLIEAVPDFPVNYQSPGQAWSHTASALTTLLRSYRGTEQDEVPGDPNGSALSGLGPDPKVESP